MPFEFPSRANDGRTHAPSNCLKPREPLRQLVEHARRRTKSSQTGFPTLLSPRDTRILQTPHGGVLLYTGQFDVVTLGEGEAKRVEAPP